MTEPDTFTAPACGWHCFHCGDHFPGTRDGQEAAREHFGERPDIDPACIERTTSTHAEIMARYRKALKREARLHQLLHRQMDEVEIAEFVNGGLEQSLKRYQGVDITELQLRSKDFDTYMRALHTLNPEVFQALHRAVSGPGTYYPPSEPA